MTKNNPRLLLRNHTYYVRVAIPRNLTNLTKYKEIRYSLKTNDYRTAVEKLRRESYKLDLYIDFLKELDMEIRNNKVILTDTELDQLLIYRLRVINDFIENNYYGIRNGSVSFNDIGLFTQKALDKYNEETFDPNVPDDITTDATDITFLRYTTQKLFYQFLEWMGKNPNIKLSTKRLIEEIKEQRAALFQITENHKDSQRGSQILNFIHTLNGIEEYSELKIKRLKDNKRTGTDNPKIRHLLDAMFLQKSQELANSLNSQTPWEKLFEEMVKPDKHSKTVSEQSIIKKRKCLETIFELIDTPYVENLTFEDIKKANSLIYRVPKKWRERYPNKRLLDVLLDEDYDINDKRAMSATNIYKYLTVFQEFLKFGRKQRLINEDMADIIKKPSVDKNNNTWKPFDEEDLQKIFNPKTYFKRTKNSDNAKFWIPLISLYSGMRLNEICQLRMEDIKVEDNIYYFDIINDEEKKQSTKNFSSQRRVPIHPTLIQIGLIKQIEQQRKLKKERLFDSLNYNKKNKYAGAISNAFRYYLDSKVGITDPKKVFHSFRHTARGRYFDNGVSEEEVNILCGWEGVGAGAKNYTHRDKIKTKKLYKAISKLKYPEIEQMLLN